MSHLSNGSAELMSWSISQIQESVSAESSNSDLLTCVDFNETGELLAVGDRGGRIIVFKRSSESPQPKYTVYCAFTSHEPEFDYLKSLEIEEKINHIAWLPRVNAVRFLLSANDKTIKLWRLSERQMEAYNFNLREDDGSPRCLAARKWEHAAASGSALRVPRFRMRPSADMRVEANPRRVYANAHHFNINTVSMNSDQETFLSADDLRINLWHLNYSDNSFMVVDRKPSNMEELTEVITVARFHSDHCNLLAYGSSRAVVRLCDMRQRTLCDEHAILFEDPGTNGRSGFFSDIISSVSDMRFSRSGRYILTRDYLMLKVWDIRMGSCPVETYAVHEPFRSQLCLLYENDCIFDKFQCAWADDDRYVVTGSYGNLFRLFDRDLHTDWLHDAGCANHPTRPPPAMGTPLSPKRFLHPDTPTAVTNSTDSSPTASTGTVTTAVSKAKRRRKQNLSVEEASSNGSAGMSSDEKARRKPAADSGLIALNQLNYQRKMLHVSWHPSERLMAITSANQVYLIAGNPGGASQSQQSATGDSSGEEEEESEDGLTNSSSPMEVE